MQDIIPTNSQLFAGHTTSTGGQLVLATATKFLNYVNGMLVISSCARTHKRLG
jgi:hypothetical protein